MIHTPLRHGFDRHRSRLTDTSSCENPLGDLLAIVSKLLAASLAADSVPWRCLFSGASIQPRRIVVGTPLRFALKVSPSSVLMMQPASCAAVEKGAIDSGKAIAPMVALIFIRLLLSLFLICLASVCSLLDRIHISGQSLRFARARSLPAARFW